MTRARWSGLLPALLLACTSSSSSSARPAGKVTEAAPMADARADHTATLLPDGRVLLAGGMVENGVFLASLEAYEPASGHFRALGNMQSPRVGHTATLLPDGKVLLAGGLAGTGGEGLKEGVTASAELFDPATNAVAAAGPLTTHRAEHEALLLPGGAPILLGGNDGERVLSSVERYEPKSRRFVAAGALGAPRMSLAAVVLDDGTVLVTGGSTGLGRDRAVLDSAEIYDPKTGRSTPVGRMSVPRHKHAALRLGDGRVLIVGGSDARDWSGVHDTAEIYDPRTRRFSPAGKMALGRFKLPHAAAILPDGNALLAGGNRAAEVYQAASGRFLPVEGALGEPKLYATATPLRDGRVLIAGGYGNGQAGRGPVSSAKAFLFSP